MVDFWFLPARCFLVDMLKPVEAIQSTTPSACSHVLGDRNGYSPSAVLSSAQIGLECWEMHSQIQCSICKIDWHGLQRWPNMDGCFFWSAWKWAPYQALRFCAAHDCCWVFHTAMLWLYLFPPASYPISKNHRSGVWHVTIFVYNAFLSSQVLKRVEMDLLQIHALTKVLSSLLF